MEAILTLPPVTHRSMWSYLSLFKGKNKLRSSKMLRVVKQLAPMIKAAQVSRNGNDYAVPPQQFASAMEYMVDSPPASLVLPLKSNGYLLSILANNAETALQKAESADEKRKSDRGHAPIISSSTQLLRRDEKPAVKKPRSTKVPQKLKDLVGLGRQPGAIQTNNGE